MTNEELISLIRSGVDREKNMRLLCKQCRDHVFRLSVPFLTGKFLADDLMREGLKGVRIAVSKFDPDSGLSFKLFSIFWIRDSITQFIQANQIPEDEDPAEDATADDQDQMPVKDLEARKMLERFQKSREHIDMLKARLADLEDIRIVPGSNDSGGRSKSIPDVTGRQAVKIKMLEDRINKELDKWLDQNLMISDLIGQLPEAKWKAVLEARYFLNYKWEDVAKAMNYEQKNVFRIHNKAIKSLNNLLQAK